MGYDAYLVQEAVSILRGHWKEGKSGAELLSAAVDDLLQQYPDLDEHEAREVVEQIMRDEGDREGVTTDLPPSDLVTNAVSSLPLRCSR